MPVKFENLLSIQQMDGVIRRETSRADRNGREFALVLFRIKRSRRHSVSTHRLVRTILQRSRTTDEVGWFGDRHICVVLPDTPLAGAWIFADSVCDKAAERIARPVAIVYSYPGNWFNVPTSANHPAANPRITDPGFDRHARSRNKDDDHKNHDGNGSNGNGHAPSGRMTFTGGESLTDGHTNGNGHSHTNDNGNGNGNGHSDSPAADGHTNGNGSNGNGHKENNSAQSTLIAPARPQAEEERDELMSVFMSGLNSGLGRTGLSAGSVEMLLARPIPPWKRMLDLLGASFGILLAAPILIFSAIGIKLTSSGPVIFKQNRAGLGGKPFTIFKFRTMCSDAEAKKKELRKHSEQDGPAFKMKNDPRITKIGHLLRKTSIDELPQLFNVLKGDMSLVGPRPLPVDEADACQGWQRRRLDVTPGLTCIWQIFGRSTVTFAEWVRMDVAYIRRRTIFHDLKLIFMTIPAVLLRRGAR